jgi:hypothetical protein
MKAITMMATRAVERHRQIGVGPQQTRAPAPHPGTPNGKIGRQIQRGVAARLALAQREIADHQVASTHRRAESGR